MLIAFIKKLGKTLVTLGLAATSMFVGLPLAVVGSFWLHEFFLGGFYVESMIVAVLFFGAAAFTFWLSATWLAWCGGRLRRFTLRGLFLATTLIAVYMCLFAFVISDTRRSERIKRAAPPPPDMLIFP